MFHIQGDAYQFGTDLVLPTHRVWMLTGNFKLVGQKFGRCFIALERRKFSKILNSDATRNKFLVYQI